MTKKLDRALDECLERLLVKGETVEQCLRDFPRHAEALKPLLEMAVAVKQASTITPRLGFRNQLYSTLPTITSKRGLISFRWSWRPQWVMVVAIVLVVVLAGGSTVAAASSSMPDEPLYPVKLASERVRLVFTPSAMAKAEFYARLADRRVAEIVQMAGENKAEQIEPTARYLNAYLTEIATLSSSDRMGGRLMRQPTGAAPEAARGESDRGSREIERRARLRGEIRQHADSHPARLRALLETVPPSARPALLRAITLSESGYKEAIESLAD